ncbi:unnamed protein product [Oppiella nova]|uniref:Protein kinase domain-containing protein n=1 Tax=Oppiella nova TaxID=334625 RepID=A0A7R9LD15_9ACAR|nr:unnamed protein product [Oppiella nova]CAG2162341.1 unnamed protein product [Oppiella nova]
MSSLLHKNWSTTGSKTRKDGCEQKSDSKFEKFRKRLSLRLDRFSLSRDELPELDNENGNVEITRISMNGNYLSNDTIITSNTPSNPLPIDNQSNAKLSTVNENESADQSPPKPPPRTTSKHVIPPRKPCDPQSDQNLSQNIVESDVNVKTNTETNKEERMSSTRESTQTKGLSFMRKQFSKVKSRPKSDIFVTNNSIGFPIPIAKSTRYSTIDFSTNSFSFGKMESYVKLDQLGEGSYATVYKGYSKVVALKEIRLQVEEGTPFTAIREASLLRGLKHANIVTLHDIIHTKDSLTFVFEYVDTDLSQYLERHSGGLNHKNVKLFLFQLFRGLSYCHERHILHRDLKPQNLLISEIGELKLADFGPFHALNGLARAKSIPSHTYSHEVVTLWYRPPDVLLGSRNYSTSLDIWGVGCIFLEMVCGAPAFPGVRDPMDQLDKIWRILGTPSNQYWEAFDSLPTYKKGQLVTYRAQPLSQAFPKLSSIAYGEELAEMCLKLMPRLRISAKDALKHRYFCDLPQQVFQLNDNVSIFRIAGCLLSSETNNFPMSVMKAAAKLRR